MDYNRIISYYLPSDWQPFQDIQLVEIKKSDPLYTSLSSKISYNAFCEKVTNVYKIENKYLFGQYVLKKEEYELKGYFWERELFHDTAQNNIDSILKHNLDRRRAFRVKFGKGVSFSPCPVYANRQSSRSNGHKRAMIVATVLVGREQHVTQSEVLPVDPADTTVGNCGQVVVKFYDNEFYPKYVIYYNNY